MKVPIAGGAPERIDYGGDAEPYFGVDVVSAFWFVRDEVYQVNRFTGAATRVGDLAIMQTDPVMSPAGVFWGSYYYDTYYITRLEGGLHTVYSLHDTLDRPTSLALDDEFVYWNESSAGRILKAPHDGGEPIEVAADQRWASWLAADDVHLYWVAWPALANARIVRIARTGGEPELFHEPAGGLSALALDDEFAYWLTQDRRILRLAK